MLSAKHCGSMSRAVDLHCILLLTVPFLPQIYLKNLYSSEFMNLVLRLKLPGCERWDVIESSNLPKITRFALRDSSVTFGSSTLSSFPPCSRVTILCKLRVATSKTICPLRIVERRPSMEKYTAKNVVSKRQWMLTPTAINTIRY